MPALAQRNLRKPPVAGIRSPYNGVLEIDTINSSISGSDQISPASLSKRSVVATVNMCSVYASGVFVRLVLHMPARIPPVRPARPAFATFVAASAPTDEALQSLLHKIIARLMNLPTRRGVLGEEEGAAYLRPTAMPIWTMPARSGRCRRRLALTASSGPRAGAEFWCAAMDPWPFC